MNTNTLRPEYAEIAETHLLALDAGHFDSIPDEIAILELVERCQKEADRSKNVQGSKDMEHGAMAFAMAIAMPTSEELRQDIIDARTRPSRADPATRISALTSALIELEAQADKSLDYRPEFREAISKAYTALAQYGDDEFKRYLQPDPAIILAKEPA